jgi:hypothetical protein
MSGGGGSPEGNKPFLDLLELDTKATTRLWQSSPPFLESVGSIMSDANVRERGGVVVCRGVGRASGLRLQRSVERP